MPFYDVLVQLKTTSAEENQHLLHYCNVGPTHWD